MKFDFYKSYLNDTKEEKIRSSHVRSMFTVSEFERMVGTEAAEIIKGGWKYWAEEAMDYVTGSNKK